MKVNVLIMLFFDQRCADIDVIFHTVCLVLFKVMRKDALRVEFFALYKCGNTIVKRYGYQTEAIGTRGNKCRFCGVELNFKTD